MLTHDEELWEKELPPAVEELLSSAKDPLADRSDRCESLMSTLTYPYMAAMHTYVPANGYLNSHTPTLSPSFPLCLIDDLHTLIPAPPPARPGAAIKRDKTKVVSFRVPHNAAVQIYDYKEKAARVVFGPDLVMLKPDEQFTQLSLSGGKPKRPNVIKSLCLLLGPDFCTDIITIETSDHARLQLQLSYNW